MPALAPNACTMLHARGVALDRPALARRSLIQTNVATARPTVLQSLDLHSVKESEVEGLGIIPRSWGTPAGRLFSQGEHVCELDALKYLGISCEAGPIVLGRDHFYAAVLSTVFSKLQRRHVGSWLLEAARKPEAAATFEAHAELKAWVVHLAEQRFGKGRFLLVQKDSPSAQEAASHLQTLSPCFGKELHSIPVAFTHDTPASAHELLFAWLLELPDAQAGTYTSQDRPENTASGTVQPTVQPTAAAAGPDSKGVLTAPQDHVRLVLQAVSGLLPYKPSLIVKQLPAAGSAAFNSRVVSESCVPAAAALAAAASRSAGSIAAAASAAAAGWVDGKACICVTSGLLEENVCGAAFVVVTAAMQGLQLSSWQGAAAFEAATLAESVAAVTMAAAQEEAPAVPQQEKLEVLAGDGGLTMPAEKATAESAAVVGAWEEAAAGAPMFAVIAV